MSHWRPWSDEVFAQAKAQGKPILAMLGPAVPDCLRQESAAVERLFLAVLVDGEERPDAAIRVGRGHAVVLDAAGARRAVLPLPASGLADTLERLAAEAVAYTRGRPEPRTPAWTGASRVQTPAPLPSGPVLDQAFATARAGATADGPCLDALETLAYAASERGDREALSLLEDALGRLLDGPLWDRSAGAFAAQGQSALSANARRVRLLWDARSLTGRERWGQAAEAASLFMLRSLYDPAVGAFHRSPKPAPPVFAADSNAQAVRAMLSAYAFGVAGARDAAAKTLMFLRSRLYDPLLGLQHCAQGPGASVCGLLCDVAWTALAFAESAQAEGSKQDREFADALLRFLFQELWERENGGFLDRMPRAGDPGILAEPHLDAGLNAVALEVCWRLHHLKGNTNYRRWLDWGLRGLWSSPAIDESGRCALARVADMAERGRLDFELVGRLAGPKCQDLLRAAVRQYAPRAIISIVDPDDQDYILAHKLTADSYPRLFGCGADLRRLSDTDDPARVPEVFAAARASEGV